MSEPNEFIKELLDDGLEGRSCALGRVGAITDVDEIGVYIERRGRKFVTTFNSGDKVLVSVSPREGVFTVLNDD